MKFFSAVSKIFIIFFLYEIGLSQISKNDPRLKKILNQSGLSIEDAKNIIGSEINENDFNIENPNDDYRSSDRVPNQIKSIRQLNQSRAISDSLYTVSNAKDILNTDSLSEFDKLLDDETIKAVKDKVSKDVQKNIVEQTEDDAYEDLKETYFGYNIFQGNPEIFQSSLGESIDPNYLIGPGDEIILMLWGETEINKSYVVSRDGYLFIPNVGQVFVNSYTLSELEKKMFKLLKKAYSSLDPDKGVATTFFDVSLGSLSLQPLRVFVLGEVDKPGAYNMKSSATLFTSLYYFGGPKISGSLREIHLIRDEEKIAVIDFYDYLLTGMRSGDVSLQRDDVIFIPPRVKTITTQGEIKKAMKFELKDDENIDDIIRFAGGLMPSTYMKRVRIDRIQPASYRVKNKVNRTVIDVDLRKIKDLKNSSKLFDGDIIRFFPIGNKQENIVTIYGNVERPGVYDLGQGLKLMDLIIKSDSLKNNTFLDRVDIVRQDERGGQKNLIKINLKNAISGDSLSNINLKSNDVVTIYNFARMSYSTNVAINGHVKDPGSKEFYKGMDVYDLVFLGGGFENKKHLKNTYLLKADMFKKNENNEVTEIISFRLDSVLIGKGIANKIIEMGDEIRIYSMSEIIESVEKSVTVSGVVKRPGTYPIDDKTMLSDVIFRAGGMDDIIFRNKVFMERVDVIRKKINDKSSKLFSFNLSDVLDSSKSYDFKLEREDKIRVYSNNMFLKKNTVEIGGEIENPGVYPLLESMDLDDLILLAGGFKERMPSHRVDVYSQVSGKATESNSVYIKTFNFESNAKSFSKNNAKHKNRYFLLDGDEVVVRDHPSFEGYQYVTIEGAVNYPGKYIIQNKNEMVSSIIDRAGGLNAVAYPLASRLLRNQDTVRLSFEKLIKNSRSPSNFSVIDGDLLIIGTKTNLIEIVGAVNAPGNYQYFKNKNIQDYIKLAGGLSENADSKKIFVNYPNGSSKKQKNILFSPYVADGSTIYVGLKEDLEPFNLTTYVTNLTTLWTDITQAYLLILLTFRSGA
jgi:protein involved in polysaccharide export with SLBB domain